MIHFLTEKLWFPEVTKADKEGILAIGGDLSVERLILAYESGIFPWYNQGETPILWWAPPKRMVVIPSEYKVHKSLRNIINRGIFEVTMNRDFYSVIRNCKSIYRKGQEGTWISYPIIESYSKLYELGKIKSVEVWQDGELVGGLYGVDLNNGVFCGESMFSKVSNASKVAFVYLINYLKEQNYRLLDCQIHNDHLERLGAFEIPRHKFMEILTQQPQKAPNKWISCRT